MLSTTDVEVKVRFANEGVKRIMMIYRFIHLLLSIYFLLTYFIYCLSRQGVYCFIPFQLIPSNFQRTIFFSND